MARKILSCVARVKQTLGHRRTSPTCCSARATEKVVACGHAELSTFGLLKQEPVAAVRGYIEQLVAGGLLAREGDPYPVLRLTGAGAALLRGAESTATLYREAQPVKGKSRAARRARAVVVRRRPRSVRRAARGQDCGSRASAACRLYVIFHDTTLREMAERRPTTLDDLHDIYGVGAKKAADFGDAFLDAIRTFKKPE